MIGGPGRFGGAPGHQPLRAGDVVLAEFQHCQRHRRVEIVGRLFERLFQMLSRIVRIFKAQLGNRQRVQSVGIAGRKGQSFFRLLLGLPDHLDVVVQTQDLGELDLRVHVLRIQLYSPLKLDYGALSSACFQQNEAELVMRFRIPWHCLDRIPEIQGGAGILLAGGVLFPERQEFISFRLRGRGTGRETGHSNTHKIIRSNAHVGETGNLKAFRLPLPGESYNNAPEPAARMRTASASASGPRWSATAG